MAKMKYAEARDKALAAGASQDRINQYAKSSFGGPVFKRNMIVALHMHPWHNDADAWARLAGALMPARLKVA